jgi:dipeptidyl aminopeptidase/acylaminoacyl peptidase
MKDALQPFTSEGLRAHKFQSGKIKVGEKTLETEFFTRYPISYPSEGLTITGILQIPKVGKAPYPVIMMNHGFFARSVYHSGDGTDRAAEFLNKRGYLTLATDYRSWGESEVGVSMFYSGLAIDVINLMNALPSLKEADPKRVGMWGHSMGGGATLKVLTILGGRVTSQGYIETTPQADDDPTTRLTTTRLPIVKAAVLYSSVSADFADIIARWGPGCLGDLQQAELAPDCNSSDLIDYDLPPDLIAAYFNATHDEEMMQAVSPLYHLDDVSAPVQIVYGTEDGQTSAGTPPEWSIKMYEGFVKAEKDAQLFAHEGEGHSFSPQAWFPFMERAGQFFDQYVKP